MLTQARASGGHTGARYGSFAGRVAHRQVGQLTQWHAFGTGLRYGSFVGRVAGVPPPQTPPTGGPIHGLIEPRRRNEKRRQRARLFEEYQRRIEPSLEDAEQQAPEQQPTPPPIETSAARSERSTPEQIVARTVAAGRFARKTRAETDDELILLLAMLEMLDD